MFSRRYEYTLSAARRHPAPSSSSVTIRLKGGLYRNWRLHLPWQELTDAADSRKDGMGHIAFGTLLQRDCVLGGPISSRLPTCLVIALLRPPTVMLR